MAIRMSNNDTTRARAEDTKPFKGEIGNNTMGYQMDLVDSLMQERSLVCVSRFPDLTGTDDDESSDELSVASEETTELAAALVTTPTPTRKRLRRADRVTFGDVEIREYAMTVGDSPVAHGFPLALDWKHSRERVELVDLYEKNRQGKRSGLRELRTLTPTERRCRLRSTMGFDDDYLRKLERQRKIVLTKEWAYGKDERGIPKSFSKHTTATILKNYIL